MSEGRRSLAAYLQAMGVELYVRRMMPEPHDPSASSDGEPAITSRADLAGRPVPAVEQPSLAADEKQPAASRDEAVSRRRAPTKEGGLPPAPCSGTMKEQAAPVEGINSRWLSLQKQVSRCTRCPDLVRERSQTVFGVGNPNADWTFIGEAPGFEEDKRGEPFVGRAGQLLNRMLHAMGLRREDVYIANVIKCRPPDNRNPSPTEIGNCAAYLRAQIDMIEPKIIVALGAVAAHALLACDSALKHLRGRRHVYADTSIPLIVTYHPAYLLRAPRQKKGAWEDLQMAMKIFAELPPQAERD